MTLNIDGMSVTGTPDELMEFASKWKSRNRFTTDHDDEKTILPPVDFLGWVGDPMPTPICAPCRTTPVRSPASTCSIAAESESDLNK